MARMAIYETGEGEKVLHISTYQRKDYVALQLFKSFFYGTAAFVILFVFWLSGQEDFLLAIDSIGVITGLLTNTVIIYIVFMVAYMVFSFFVARKQYDTAVRQSRAYRRRLRRVAASYKNENQKNKDIVKDDKYIISKNT